MPTFEQLSNEDPCLSTAFPPRDSIIKINTWKGISKVWREEQQRIMLINSPEIGKATTAKTLIIQITLDTSEIKD